MEIRNITPMNSTPVFGMAFKAPDEKDMVKLVDYLLKSGMSAKEAKRAMVQMQKVHAGDTHFDFKYIYEKGADTFAIAPKSEPATKMVGEGKIIFSTSTSFDNLGAKFYDRAERCERRCDYRLKGKRGIKKFFAKVANFVDRKVLAFDRLIDPTTALPAELRQVSARVKQAEATVNKRLSDEAAIRSAFSIQMEPVGRPYDEIEDALKKSGGKPVIK